MNVDFTREELALLLRLTENNSMFDGDEDAAAKDEVRRAAMEKLAKAVEAAKPRVWPPPGWRPTTPEYRALAKAAGWGPYDRYGHAVSPVDPLEVLRVADAPQAVVAACEAAVGAGCTVQWESYSCHIGGWESVVVLAPVPDDVRAMFDAIDASGVRDGRLLVMHPTRWFDGQHREDGRERWEWTLDDG